MIPYIDIHAHHAPADGVVAIQNLLNPDTAAQFLASDGFYSIGIHPRHIHPDHWQEDVAVLKTLMHHAHVLAIGEVGLDGLSDLPLAVQDDVFIAMVELSEQSKKPLIIHAVRTHHQIAMFHRNLNPSQPWIIHGFNVRDTIAKGLLNQGLYLSFGEALLKHHSPAAAAVTAIPLEFLFIESDDRQLDIRELYQHVAALRRMEVEALKENIYQRFCKIFGYEGS